MPQTPKDITTKHETVVLDMRCCWQRVGELAMFVVCSRLSVFIHAQTKSCVVWPSLARPGAAETRSASHGSCSIAWWQSPSSPSRASSSCSQAKKATSTSSVAALLGQVWHALYFTSIALSRAHACVSVHVCASLSLCLPVSLSLSVSVSLFVSLSLSLSLSLCLSVCLSCFLLHVCAEIEPRVSDCQCVWSLDNVTRNTWQTM